MKYNPGNTAISRNGPSKPAKTIAASSLNNTNILDVGCGKGADLAFYKKRGSQVTGYDPYQEGRNRLPKGQFRLITITYVLNVQRLMSERINTLKRARYFLEDGGHMVVTVRPATKIEREAKNKNWERASFTAYWSNEKRGMCQAALTKETILKYAHLARLKESKIKLKIPGATCIILEKKEDQ